MLGLLLAKIQLIDPDIVVVCLCLNLKKQYTRLFIRIPNFFVVPQYS